MTKIVIRTKETISIDGKEIVRETEEEETLLFGIKGISSLTGMTGFALALLTGIVAAVSYCSQVNKDAETSQFNRQKPFFDKQMEFYVDAMTTAEKIAIPERPAPDDVIHFWGLYWGRLGAVEDEHVDYAMVTFGALICKQAARQCLTKASLVLAHCIKQSWADTWSVPGLKIPLPKSPELECSDQNINAVGECSATEARPLLCLN